MSWSCYGAEGCSFLLMCRSIKVLREGATPAPDEDIEAAARQFVRKISGFSKPAAHNQDVFDQAIAEIADASQRLLDGLEIRGARKAS
jgi:hypothetical protein